MLSSLNPFDSGETLRATWGEFFPIPARRRLQEVDMAVSNVLNCIQSGDANVDRNNIRAKGAVDEVIKLDVVANDLTAAEEGQRINKASVQPDQGKSANGVLDENLMRENVRVVREKSNA
jgi:hypothetical protein